MAVSFSDVVFALIDINGYEDTCDLIQLCLEEMTEEQFERACLKHFYTCKSADDIAKYIPKSYFEDCEDCDE